MLMRCLLMLALLMFTGCGTETGSRLMDDTPDYKLFVALSKKANPLDDEMFAIMASAKIEIEKDSLKICLDSLEECKKDDANTIEYDLVDKDGKEFYVSKEFHVIEEDMLITVIAKDDAGELVARTVKIKPFDWTSPEVQPELEEVEPKRYHVGLVEFSKWDYSPLRIDLALVPPKDENSEVCEIVDPIKSDNTTLWKPMQVYWVNYKKDRRMVDAFKDTFVKGDSISKDDFTRNGKTAVGVMSLTSTHRSFFKIQGIKVKDDRSEMSGEISIPSASAKINLKVTTSFEDGKCAFKTYGSLNAAELKPIKSIYVKQNFIGAIREITFK